VLCSLQVVVGNVGNIHIVKDGRMPTDGSLQQPAKEETKEQSPTPVVPGVLVKAPLLLELPQREKLPNPLLGMHQWQYPSPEQIEVSLKPPRVDDTLFNAFSLQIPVVPCACRQMLPHGLV
jgi:hypothetical protein